jgi:hypothetical protein
MDNTLPVYDAEGLPEVFFPSGWIHDDRVTVSTSVAGLVRTNLAGAPYFVHVTGAKVFGRDPLGHMTMYINTPNGRSGTTISLTPSDTLPVVLGRVITLVAVVSLALLGVAGLARHVRTRFRRGMSLHAPSNRAV